jgi:hypothetical protein
MSTLPAGDSAASKPFHACTALLCNQVQACEAYMGTQTDCSVPEPTALGSQLGATASCDCATHRHATTTFAAHTPADLETSLVLANHEVLISLMAMRQVSGWPMPTAVPAQVGWNVWWAYVCGSW